MRIKSTIEAEPPDERTRDRQIACAELMRAMTRMSTNERFLIANIVRRLVAIEAAEGPDVAEATLERLIRTLEQPNPPPLI